MADISSDMAILIRAAQAGGVTKIRKCHCSSRLTRLGSRSIAKGDTCWNEGSRWCNPIELSL